MPQSCAGKIHKRVKQNGSATRGLPWLPSSNCKVCRKKFSDELCENSIYARIPSISISKAIHLFIQFLISFIHRIWNHAFFVVITLNVPPFSAWWQSHSKVSEHLRMCSVCFLNFLVWTLIRRSQSLGWLRKADIDFKSQEIILVSGT